MDTVEGSPPSLTHYGAFVRRQWRVIVGAVLLGAVLTVAALQVLPSRYTTSASVLVEASGVASTQAEDARMIGEVNMDTEAQVVRSMPVADAVRQALRSPLTTSALIDATSVTVPPNTTILTITYEADSAEAAQAGADAFADAYLTYRTARAEQEISARLGLLGSEADDVRGRIQTITTQLNRLSEDSARRPALEQQLSMLRTRAARIDEQTLPLLTARTEAGSVIDTATLPSAPASPNRMLVGGSTIALGLLFGLVLAWWRDRRLGKIRQPEELEEDYGLDLLGVVHHLELGEESLQHYRQVVHAIRARLSGGDRDSVLVSGVGSSPAAANVAHTLAQAVARSGSSVSLVYSDSASAAEHASAGATTVEVSGFEDAELVVDGNIQSARLHDYLARTDEEPRLRLLATPPMQLSADAQAVAPLVGLTVLVTELDVDTHADVQDALRQLRQVGAQDVGTLTVAGTRARRRRRLVSRREEQRPLPEGEEPVVTADGSGSTPDHRPTSAAFTEPDREPEAGQELEADPDPDQELEAGPEQEVGPEQEADLDQEPVTAGHAPRSQRA